MESWEGSLSAPAAVGTPRGSSDDNAATEEQKAISIQQQQQSPSLPRSSPASETVQEKSDSPRAVTDSPQENVSVHLSETDGGGGLSVQSDSAVSNAVPPSTEDARTDTSGEQGGVEEPQSIQEDIEKSEMSDKTDAPFSLQQRNRRQREHSAEGGGAAEGDEAGAESTSSAAETGASGKETSRRYTRNRNCSSSSSSSSSVSGEGGNGRRRGTEGNLLRLFQSEVFDAHFHLYYLFRRQEPGVQQYLVNMLYTRRTAQEVQFYLPQLCQLALTRFSSSPLQRYLLDICSVSIHLALKAAWLFQASVEDRIPGIEEAAQKMTQEVEMAVVNCRPLGHSGYSSGSSSSAESRSLRGSSGVSVKEGRAKTNQQEEGQEQWQQQQRSVDPTLFKRNTLYKLYLQMKRFDDPALHPQSAPTGSISEGVTNSSEKPCVEKALDAEAEDSQSETLADPQEPHAVTQPKLQPPVLPSVFRSNTGPVSLPGAKVRLPSVYAKLGNPLSLTTLTPPAPCCSSTTGCCKDASCLAAELHQFVMKQRRCDYFNALNHFVSILVDASNILAAEPDRTMRLFVAAQAANFALTGVTVPLQLVGAEPMQPSQQQQVTESQDKACCRGRKHGMGLGSISLGLSPPSNFAVQILRIDSRESKTLNSKKRAPFLIVLEVCDLDEDLQEFSDDPERQREEIKIKSLFVLQCIVKELKQRKLLPPGYTPESDPVSTVRQVLGMLPVPSAASAASAGGSSAKTAATGGLNGTRLQQMTMSTAAAPWRPLQRQVATTSKAAAAAVAAAAVAAATAAAALTGESEETSCTDTLVETGAAAPPTCKTRNASSGGEGNDAAASAAALKVSENHFAHKPQKEFPESPAMPVKTNALWGELWAARRERLRRRSPYGSLKSWDIKCVLVKGGDDLRQELLASQLVRQFKAIFEEARLPLWLRPYEILVTGSNSGLMECIPDTCSVDVLKKKHGVDSIATVFDILFADNPFEARKNFIESHAAYSLVSYFLQVKDRHNGNLLLDAEGHVIHIDYGFLLSNSPGNINFETAPFKLTQEFLDVMGGEISDNYEYFRTLIVRGFLEARKHADRIVLMVEMMLSASKMPCFAGGPQYTLDALKERFMCSLPEDACIQKVVELIDTSVNNFRTVQYDNFQRITNGIL